MIRRLDSLRIPHGGMILVAWIAAAVVLLAVVGVGWFLVAFSLRRAAMTGLLLHRYREHHSAREATLVVAGFLIALAFLGLALLVFRSGDRSLLDILRD